MKEIVWASNDYDVGIYIFEPSNFNHQHALPNKLFEFLQARLAVAIGPSPEMANIIRKYDCGVIAKDFKPETMAEELRTLSREKLIHLKQHSARAAQEVNSERNMTRLSDIVSRFMAIEEGR